MADGYRLKVFQASQCPSAPKRVCNPITHAAEPTLHTLSCLDTPNIFQILRWPLSSSKPKVPKTVLPAMKRCIRQTLRFFDFTQIQLRQTRADVLSEQNYQFSIVTAVAVPMCVHVLVWLHTAPHLISTIWRKNHHCGDGPKTLHRGLQ
jgi:hypothetical protein